MSDKADLAHTLGSRLDDAQERSYGDWRGTCPGCGAPRSMYVTHRGYSCANSEQCSLRGRDLSALKKLLDDRDTVEAAPDNPGFDRALGSTLDALNERKLGPIDVVPTHLPKWNACCRDEGGGEGIARGWHCIVAGNTGMGKSLLALNLAAEAVRRGEGVGLISLEMSQSQTLTRFMSIFTRVPVMSLEWGKNYDPEAAQRAKEFIEESHHHKGGFLATNRRPISTLSDITTAMKYLHEYEGCRYFITDYLQLAGPGAATHLSERITEVSHTVRGMATSLDAVSIGVSQFKRETSGSNERPKVQGLMGGSSLENDADQITILDHTTYERSAMGIGLVKLLIAKNRHGPVQDVPLCWDYATLRCYETEASRFKE